MLRSVRATPCLNHPVCVVDTAAEVTAATTHLTPVVDATEHQPNIQRGTKTAPYATERQEGGRHCTRTVNVVNS